jgi:hypothetical protein
MLLGHPLLAALDEYTAHNGLAGDGDADPGRRRLRSTARFVGLFLLLVIERSNEPFTSP